MLSYQQDNRWEVPVWLHLQRVNFTPSTRSGVTAKATYIAYNRVFVTRSNGEDTASAFYRLLMCLSCANRNAHKNYDEYPHIPGSAVINSVDGYLRANVDHTKRFLRVVAR